MRNLIKLSLGIGIITALVFANVLAAENAAVPAPSNQVSNTSNQPLPTKDLVNQLFTWFNSLSNTNTSMSTADFNKHFSENAVQYTNGVRVATGAHGFYNRFIAARKIYARWHIDIADILVEGNKAAVRYTIKFVKPNGEQTTINDIAFIQFDNGKVTNYWESFHGEDPIRITQ